MNLLPNILNMKARFFFLLVALYLFVFEPQLRMLTTIYAIMLLLVETMKPGEQQSSTKLVSGMLWFFGGLLATGILLAMFGGTYTSSIGEVGLITAFAFFAWVAHTEEEIFRVILPKTTGIIISLTLYTLFHVFLLTNFYGLTGTALILPLAVTALFGGIAHLTIYAFKNANFAKGMHTAVDLLKNGYLLSILATTGMVIL